MLLWIKYKKTLLHSAEHVTNRKWEAASTTKPHRGKGRHSSPVILCKCSFELSSSFAIDIPRLFKVCHEKFYRQWNAPIGGEMGHAVPSSTGRGWELPLLTQSPQCDGSSGGVNTMSHPVSEDNCFKLFLSPPKLQIYLDIQKIHSLGARAGALAVTEDAWQPLRGPAQTSQGTCVSCIYCQVCSTESTQLWKHQNVSLKILQHNLSV